MLDPARAKGLEFDHVVLVEPAAIAAEATGSGDLYVAMTRPTRHLDVVHAEPLPAGFERAELRRPPSSTWSATGGRAGC